MDRAGELLGSLADGRPRSGEELGKTLDVSRAAVWKLVHQLQEQGVPLISEQGRGYRLARPLELLDRERIRAGLEADVRQRLVDVRLARVIDSTNRQLFQQLSELHLPCALFAEAQSAGRGRRGRAWHSPFGQNLYMSLAWSFEEVPGGVAGLSLAAGMSVAEVLRGFGLGDVSLKWPNDLVINGQKLGGLLVEIQGEPAGPCAVVIGAGLNLQMDADDTTRDAIDQPWTAVRERLPQWPGRNVIAGAVLNGLVRAMDQFGRNGFAAFRQRWSDYDALSGRDVRLFLGQQEIHGRACGVDATGSLLMDQGRGPEPWSAGEVSVRPLP